MLHTFKCTAYEVAEFNYANLVKFGFAEESSLSRFVGQWKTYNFSDYAYGQDIVINFDSDVQSFQIQDMMPGDIIYITYDNGIEEEITIGITGAYFYEGSTRRAVKIRIPNDYPDHKITGQIECQYNGLKYTLYDSITDIQLKTIVSKQFIGVDPDLIRLKDWYDYAKTTIRGDYLYSINPEYSKLLHEKTKPLNIRILSSQHKNIEDTYGNNIELFDYYVGENIDDSKKSLAYNLKFKSLFI